MTSRNPLPSLDEVLDAFAVEEKIDRTTLEAYLSLYPEYALELVDLSNELLSGHSDYEGELSSEDQAILKRAWAIHEVASAGKVSDPFADLSREELKALARELEVPRQILTVLRERCVELSSIPNWILRKLADRLHKEQANLFVYFTYPPGGAHARSYKSDDKPDAIARVTFEQALIDAGVSEDKRKSLLADS